MSIKSFSEYLLHEKNYSQHTISAYRNDIEELKEYLKTNYDLDKVDEVDYSLIRQWIVQLVDKGISNRSINRKVSSLNSYYKFLQKTQVITINPLKKHRALKVGKQVNLPFSQNELKEVLDNTIEIIDFETA